MTSKAGEKSMLKTDNVANLRGSRAGGEDRDLVEDEVVGEALVEIQNTMLAQEPQLAFPSKRDSFDLIAELEKEHLRRSADNAAQVAPRRQRRLRVFLGTVAAKLEGFLDRRRRGGDDVLLVAVPATVLAVLMSGSATAIPAAVASGSAAAVLLLRLLKGRVEERVVQGDRARLSSELDLARCSRVRRNLARTAGQRRLQVLEEVRRQSAGMPGGGPDEALVSVVLAQKSVEQFMGNSRCDKRERDAAALVAASDLRLHRAKASRRPVRHHIAKCALLSALGLALMSISWLPVAFGGGDYRWAMTVAALAVTATLAGGLVTLGLHLCRSEMLPARELLQSFNRLAGRENV